MEQLELDLRLGKVIYHDFWKKEPQKAPTPGDIQDMVKALRESYTDREIEEMGEELDKLKDELGEDPDIETHPDGFKEA